MLSAVFISRNIWAIRWLLVYTCYKRTYIKYVLLFGGPEAEETTIFVKMFDEWFDAMNICNFSDGQYHRKPFKKPYRSGEDFCLEVYNLYSQHALYIRICIFIIVA